MIAGRPVLSNAWRAARRRSRRLPRAGLAAAGLALLAGCADPLPVPRTASGEVAAFAQPGPMDGVFVMEDGARLPYRHWLPPGEHAADQPWAVVLALHGMNDSRDAWEIPAPALARSGIAVYAPDQRGFGDAPGRGHFAGAERMAADAAIMAQALRRRYPGARLVLLGESMGAAVLMRLAAAPGAAPADAYVLVAPAVWGRAEMNVFMRTGLWVLAGVFPGFTNTGSFAHVTASDNRAALRRLSWDPLTIHATRFDAISGLVDLMDAAQAAAPAMRTPALVLYGGKDELIPKSATATTWRTLPAGVREAYYPQGYHLLLRDTARAVVLADVIAWIADPAAPLPSGADGAAGTWLAGQERDVAP